MRDVGFLLIVTGPPGAGKSTVAQLIVDGLEKGVLVPGDDFFGFLEGQLIAPWLPESHDQNEVVTEAAAAAAGRFATGGYATVYDGVVGAWSLDLFASATGLQSLHYVVLMPSIEQCLLPRGQPDRPRLSRRRCDAPHVQRLRQRASR